MLFKNLLFFINLLNISKRDFCKKIGITEPAFWLWKKGNNPSPNTLRRIAKYFSDTLTEIYLQIPMAELRRILSGKEL
jgi:transcriptional regulator with XRE-family HTH domain